MEDNALALIQSWINTSSKKVTAIPRMDFQNRCEELLGISEYSALGTLVNHTGGLSVADGLIRHFAGNNAYHLSIKSVNAIVDQRPVSVPGVLIVADDIFGGLFGINVALPLGKPGDMLYLPPDTYLWENLGVGHTAFLNWSILGDTNLFYRKYSVLNAPQNVPFFTTLSFHPPLWTQDVVQGIFTVTQMDSRKSHVCRFGILSQLL